MLPVVIEVDHVRAAGVAPAGQHGVVFAEVAGVFDVGHRHARRAEELAAHLGGAVAATVVHQHDLVPARNREPFDLVHHRRDRLRAVVERDDERKRGCGSAHAQLQPRMVVQTLSTSARSRPGWHGRQSTSAHARSVTGKARSGWA